MATATTTEKLASELVNIIKSLETERDKLLALRKDLKRFMDIDKEKAELEFLRSEKDKLLATASKEAEAIKKAARKAADRVMENGNENARIIADDARKIRDITEQKLRSVEEREAKVASREDAMKQHEAGAVEREKRLMLREDRIGTFVERMKDTLASL